MEALSGAVYQKITLARVITHKNMDTENLCECEDRESEHVDGCEMCVIPECGCKEFQEPITEEEIKADREFSSAQKAFIEKAEKEDQEPN